MGVEQIEVRISRKNADFENLVDIKRKVEDAGIGLFEIMLNDLYSSPAFALGLPERDAEVAELICFIRNLGRAGINNTTYAWCTGGTYRTGTAEIRGCSTREFVLSEALKAPSSYSKVYTEDELWANYEAFIADVLPVAEESGVRLQLHPNDPPVNHQGIARLFSSTDAYKRALKLANFNPYSAILFCVGSWGEMAGPDGRGEDVGAALSEFVRSGHVHQVHFRNVSSPLPNFTETFIEDGYLDMRRIMRVLVESGFEGMVVPDHVPAAGESDAGSYGTEAYLLGYLRALMGTAGS